jgi:nucleotide-binding universal stress UspA family protein
MRENVSEPTILVPVDASDPADPPQALVELLSPHPLVVLGYYSVPDQTAMEQAREQFGTEATEAVTAITDRFAEQGANAESVVVFTHDRSDTIDNVAADYGVDAVLTAGGVGDFLERILVPLRGDKNLDRILGFVGMLLRDSDATATFINVVEGEDEASSGESLIKGAHDRLAKQEPIDADRLDWRVEVDSSVADAIIESAVDYDLLVLGESEPSLTDRILGNLTAEVIDRSAKPLLIVRDT